MIKRRLTQKILDSLANFPAVAILGPRQVGKTTLAKHISPLLKKPTMHIDLEKPSQLKSLTDNPEVFLDQHKDKCIIIDGVQRLPSLFPLLRPMIDAHRVAGRFILLGSASPTLLKDSSESLAGRIFYTELNPLSLSEVDPVKDFYQLWLHGGFPEPFVKKDPTIIRDWYDSFLNTYFERDLNMLGLSLSPTLLSRTFSMMAHMQGGLCNISQLSKSLAIHRNTVERIIEFFKSSYMLRRLPPFFINVKKRLVKSPKYYIRDTGVLHHTLGIHTSKELLEHPIIGSSWEGFVVEQVTNLNTRLAPYFYRTQAGAECDLVLVRGHKPVICIEAKMTNTPKMTKSLTSSLQDLQTSQNYIVIPSCDYPYTLKQGTTVCSLPWLLSNIEVGS